jgi:hypothetical protein
MKRSGPLKRRTALRRTGGLSRTPMKRKALRGRPSSSEKDHISHVASLPCLVPGCGRAATVHHVTATVHGGRISRSHQRVVPLCPKHHQIQFGPRESVEALGHGGFYVTYGIDLLKEAIRLWESSPANKHGQNH